MRKKNRKNIITSIAILSSFVIVAGIVLLFKQQSLASWVEEENGKKYENDDGQYVVGFSEIEGEQYYFDEDGYLVKGKFYVKEENAYYYADKNGVVQTGAIKTKKGFYLTDGAGKIQTGFVEYENRRYYFNSKAELVTGWFKFDENWYYADDEGMIMTGFLTLDGYRYYLNSDGTRVSDTVMDIDGVTYIFNQDGSIDENATTLYPVYEYLNQIRTETGLDAFAMNPKIQACAILRAAELVNGYGQTESNTDTLENLLKNRGVKCAGGYELSYGGIEDYGIERLITDMKKDINLMQVVKESAVSEVGLGIYEKEGIYYYDIIFIMEEDINEGK